MHLFEIEIFSYVVDVFNVYQFNASLLNKNINFFKNDLNDPKPLVISISTKTNKLIYLENSHSSNSEKICLLKTNN